MFRCEQCRYCRGYSSSVESVDLFDRHTVLCAHPTIGGYFDVIAHTYGDHSVVLFDVDGNNEAAGGYANINGCPYYALRIEPKVLVRKDRIDLSKYRKVRHENV